MISRYDKTQEVDGGALDKPTYPNEQAEWVVK
jgi:hypothetical protein